MNNHRWAIILAAGEGSRIRHFMSDGAGQKIPKQFWPIDGRETMLDWSIDRAERVVPRTTGDGGKVSSSASRRRTSSFSRRIGERPLASSCRC
jgi:CTP:molybdopterin cytidylyltransferase MocA